ncbi:MAG: rhodanese-like domain-containing protein [Saprospiraceae bacterium]
MSISLSSINAQTKIDASKVQEMLTQDKTIQLVDLRTPGELDKTGKIPGAMTINYSSPDFQERITKLDKTKPIIVYCASGGRSGKTAGILSQSGFEKIYDYSGGMMDWATKGLKTEKVQ